jgi:hypothetical protein
VIEKGKTIADLWDGINLQCTFRRTVSSNLYQTWLDIVEHVSSVDLSDEEDEMICQFNTSGLYSSQSL